MIRDIRFGLAVLSIALLFAPLRTRIQARLDLFFYKDQFEDRASLLEFARTLSSEISLAPPRGYLRLAPRRVAGPHFPACGGASYSLHFH